MIGFAAACLVSFGLLLAAGRFGGFLDGLRPISAIERAVARFQVEVEHLGTAMEFAGEAWTVFFGGLSSHFDAIDEAVEFIDECELGNR